MNMRSNEEERWMACLDGELTAAESADFELALTHNQRQRLAAERRFESALGDVLTGAATCPEPLWKRVTREIDAAAAPKQRGGGGSSSPRTRWFFPLVAMAAMAMVVAAAFLLTGRETMPAAFRMEAAHAAVLQEEVLPGIGSDEEAVDRYLASLGIPVGIRNVADFNGTSRHPVALLGAGEAGIGGQRLVELLFTCCDKPTRIILADVDSTVGRQLMAAVNQEGSDVLEVREFGGYVAGLVSKHRRNEALNLLQARTHHTAAMRWGGQSTS
jgi:hypothetical protein